jgi:hypothetical protein
MVAYYKNEKATQETLTSDGRVFIQDLWWLAILEPSRPTVP